MNNIFKKSTLLVLIMVILVSSCQKRLTENPYTVFTADYLKTPAGLQSATYALYSGMRYNYGPIGSVLIANAGTDEFTYGDQGFGGSELELGSYSITSTNGHILTPWNRNFNNINLANAVLTYAPTLEMDATTKAKILAEAHFLRGMYYLLLVQQFGAVPVDLGSGEYAFNQQPYLGFNRLGADLLKKDYQLIIDDFTYASVNLQDKRPTGAFVLSKAAAFHLLAKAYLYRAYSPVKQNTDFKSAWDVAKKLIDNQATYGTSLLANYADVSKEGNDYNAEILYSVERIQGDPNSNEVSDPANDFSNKANIANNLFNPNYQNNVAIPAGSGKFPLDRVMQYQRPLRQLCPNPYVYNVAFADKVNDSRFDGSFRTMWLATNNNCLAGAGIAIGDTAYYLAPSDAYADSLTALGTKKYRIVAPREFYLPSRTAIQLFPYLKKYEDTKRSVPNDASGRPFPVAKLSEVYLMAAEAAIGDGRPADALPLIITLRQRAAYRPGLSTADQAQRLAVMGKKNTGTPNSPVLTDYTASDMTLDFILEERTRELCGEMVRWPDLAVRGKLVERVKLYNLAAASKVQAFHSLRPIPQSQLDAINDPNKIQYQNPGY